MCFSVTPISASDRSWRKRCRRPRNCWIRTRRRRAATSSAGSARAPIISVPDILDRVDTAGILRRIDAYERLIRLDKPIGWLLLLWPTLWAVWLAARGRPVIEIVLIFVVGTILMRSAGCAMND